MEITRQQLGNGDKGAFRAKQLNARRMLAGELENEDLDAYVEERLMTTTIEKAANWARGNAFMPATFGLACCALEMMGAVNSRMDIARFGFGPSTLLSVTKTAPSPIPRTTKTIAGR